MPIVQMPDGALVELPDNPDPALLAEIEAAVAPENPVKRQAKLIGSDVVKGGLGLPAMAMDVGREVLNMPFTLGEQLGDKVMGRKPRPYAPIGPKASIALQDFGVKPQTEAEKWQSLLTQGAVGGVASPGGLTRPAVQAFTGAAAAGGSEVAARLGGDNALMRGLGGVVGGGLAGLGSSFLNRSSPRVTELARESLDGLSPDQLQAARTFMEGSGKNGMPLDFAQALEATGAQPSGMRVLRDTLANVKEGDATQALLKEQPGRLQDLSARWVGNQPGRIFSPEQAANNLSETATGVLNNARKARTAAVKPYFQAAGDLGGQFRREVLNDFSEMLQQPGLTDDSVSAIRSAMTKVKVLPATGSVMDAAEDYNQLIRELRGSFTANNPNPRDALTRGQLGELAGRLTDRLKSASPEIAEGMAKYSQISREVVDPLKQGQVGTLAGRSGYDAAKQTPVSRMTALFSAGRDPAAKHSPLLETARTLNKQDPSAFADAAKTYYSGKIAEAFDAGIGAGGKATNKDAGSKIYSSLFADSKQYAGMRDVVTATAEAAGRKPAEALRGLENFAKIVRATRSQPDNIGGMSRQQIIEMAEKHYGANAIRIFGFLPFERMARNMESATMTKTFRELDKLITTPEGVDILIKLSQTPVMDRRALALTATAGGMLQFVGKTDQNTPE
jgi:hypothetical protein